MELRRTDEGRDCTACFNSEAEARQCAALVGTREGVPDVRSCSMRTAWIWSLHRSRRGESWSTSA